MNTLVYLGISVGIFVPVIVVALALGVAGGYLVLRYILMKSGKDAKKIIEEAKKTAETHRREAVMELKQELRNMRQESDKENQAKKIAAEREIDEKKKAKRRYSCTFAGGGSVSGTGCGGLCGGD